MEVLTDENFDSMTKDGFWLVEFYAPVSKQRLAAVSSPPATNASFMISHHNA